MTPRSRLATWSKVRRALLAVWLALAGLIAWDAWRWWAAQNHNDALAAAASLPSSARSTHLAGLLSQGVRLAADGEREAALARYRDVEASGDPHWARQAQFNTANLYLREALALTAADDAARAQPLVELAKGLYRELLRADPADWAVRYNLERALRLQPEQDDDGTGNFALPSGAERAITTMRGYSPGQP